MSYDDCSIVDVDGRWVIRWSGGTGVTLMSRDLLTQIVADLNELRVRRAVSPNV